MPDNDNDQVADAQSAEAPMIESKPLNRKNDIFDNVKLSKEELEQKSWSFLERITEIVDRLGLHQSVLAIGKIMAKAGMIYIHVIDKKQVLRNLKEQNYNKQPNQKKQNK